MTEIPAGGLQVIREAVAARASAHAIIAKDCGCGIDLLGAFAAGNAALPLPIIESVVRWIWNDGIEYNAEADALQPIPKESRSLGTPPEFHHHAAINGATLSKFQLDPPPRGPQPEVKPPPVKKPRGWIGGIWE